MNVRNFLVLCFSLVSVASYAGNLSDLAIIVGSPNALGPDGTITGTLLDFKLETEQNFNETWTILLGIEDSNEDILGVLCNPILITQSDIGATTFEITSPGFYVLDENISFSPASGLPAIEIISDNVVLDFCGKVLSQSNAQLGVEGIRIRGAASASPRSNVKVRNGTIHGFTDMGINIGTNSGVPADTAATRIVLSNLDIVGCELRGIEVFGASSSAQIAELVIENCRVIECATDVAATRAVSFVEIQDAIIRDCVCNQNGSLSTNSLTVVYIDEAQGSKFVNVGVTQNQAAAGLNGFVLTGGASAAGNLLINCAATRNVAVTGRFAGFDLQAGLVRNVLQKCVALDNLASGATATSSCLGFNLDQVNSCSLLYCRAMYNRAPGNGGSNVCTGFALGTSGGGGTGVKNSEIFQCVAVGNTGFNAARSFGIRPLSGGGGNTDNAYIANVAYRNGPAGLARTNNQIVANGGSGSNAGGVPINSIKSDVLDSLNGNADERLTNIRVGD